MDKTNQSPPYFPWTDVTRCRHIDRDGQVTDFNIEWVLQPREKEERSVEQV